MIGIRVIATVLVTIIWSVIIIRLINDPNVPAPIIFVGLGVVGTAAWVCVWKATKRL